LRLSLTGAQNDTFASTTNFLGGTFRRMNNMAKRQGGNWCWFMGFLLLCIWIFIVVWWLRRCSG
jgi:blocked-early-in-transport protein 1